MDKLNSQWQILFLTLSEQTHFSSINIGTNTIVKNKYFDKVHITLRLDIITSVVRIYLLQTSLTLSSLTFKRTFFFNKQPYTSKLH